jgi:dipeptidyl aminopeptidase/acylaminoacyl peptidase
VIESIENMHKDIRQTALYQQAESLYRTLKQPGTGQISDATDVHVSPDGKHAVFAGTLVDALEGTPPTRICAANLTSGKTRVLTFGPNTDRLPKYSPDGRHIAFLSDRRKAGDFQLYLLDPSSGAARPTMVVDGWVEYLHWSPDGERILLGVAGHGADISGGQGAVTSQRVEAALPSWMPVVETGDESFRWRSAWIYELKTNTVRRLNQPGLNTWEVVWCGRDALAAVASDAPGEAAWYTASLRIIDVNSGQRRVVYSPKDQLGWPAASPSGKRLVVVEAVCSDRWIVAGDLLIVDLQTGAIERVETRGVDVTHTEWRSERGLLLGGHRGFETVVLEYDVETRQLQECWVSDDITGSGRFIKPAVAGKEKGECVFLAESFTRAPEIGRIRQAHYQTVASFDLGGQAQARESIGTIEKVSWPAPDGLEIQGWLLCPQGKGPYPLVMQVHGGPVSHWRPRWLGRHAPGLADLMLLRHGYAVFYPNPRGSSGRGQNFARKVQGDLGGAETQDHLSGLDYLVQQGWADPKRLGVTGTSHGGFMTSWLITQDERFAAAVPVASVTDRVSQYLMCAHSYYVALFLGDKYNNPGGRFFQRSPIMHAHKAKTPTLHITGALDRCTPPNQAVEFHNALLENGVESVLVVYPQEGHGVRKLPAAFDCAARIVSWFTEHMPVNPNAVAADSADAAP